MCGRFTLKITPEVISEHFGLDETPALLHRFNVTPTQDVPVIKLAEGRNLSMLHWCFVPSWAKDLAIGNNKMINSLGAPKAAIP